MRTVFLKDIATLITKGTTPTSLGYNFTDAGINFVKIESINEEGYFITEKFAHISDECNEKLNRSILQANDILFSIAGAIGRTAIVKDDILPANTNQALAIIRIPQGIYDYEFLRYVLQSPAVTEQFERKKQGVAQLNLSLKDVGELAIPIIGLAEQKKIINVLKKVSDLIALRKQQLAKLDELVKSRFVEMFGDMLINDMMWPEIPLEQLADVVSGITKGRKVTDTELFEVPYMAVSNVKDGYIDWTTVKTILATQKEIEQYRLLPYDVLMTEGGDPDKLGRGAVIAKPLENSIHQNHIFRVRLQKEKILPAFFSEYLQHQKAKRYFLGCAKQTTGIASINMTQLRALPVLTPPMKLQKQFIAFIEQTDKSKLEIQTALTKLETLKKALMQQYFG